VLRFIDTVRALRGVERSVRLMHVFLAASALILVGGAVMLGWVLSTTIRDQAVEDARTSLAEYVDGVLRPDLVRDGKVAVAPGLTARIRAQLEARNDIVTVKVWRADGTLAWTNRDAARVGRRFELDDKLGDALADNRAVAGIDGLDSEENEAEAALGFSRLLEVYAPIDVRGRPIGAYEIYADPARIESFVGARKHTLWGAVAGVFAALYAALALLVRGASSRLRRQTQALRRRSQELLEAYEMLEIRSLETIETSTPRSTRRIRTRPATRSACSGSPSRSRASWGSTAASSTRCGTGRSSTTSASSAYPTRS
jgi:hypothetical protein